MRRLSRDEIEEARVKARAVASASDLVAVARDQLDGALTAGVSQDSERWETLYNGLEGALKRLSEATKRERDWWRSKDFDL